MRRAVSSVGKRAEGEQDFVGHLQAGCERGGAANPAAAEDDVAIVKDRGLAGRDGFLRLVQLDARAAVLERRDRRARAGMAVANLHRDFERLVGIAAAAPVHLVDFEFVRDQILGVADDDAVRRRIDIDDVTRLRRTAGQTFALADGEHLDAFVFAEEIALEIVDAAG